MHATYRQIDRLVLVDKMDLVGAGDLDCSLDDDPVLGAMEMLLQGQALTWLHDDAFDLVARPGIDRLIIAHAFVSSAPPDFNPLLLRVIVSHLKGARLRGPRSLTSTVSGVQRQRWFGRVTIFYPSPP